MFWTVLVYVLVATVVAIWLGRPLIWLSFNNEKLNAAFRYGLVRLRDAAEAVGFYRGERVERAQLWHRFTPIIANYRKFVRRTIIFNGWNWSMSQAIVPLPWVIQAPRLFAGQIDFGDVGQTATAFGNIHDSLSFFRNNYDAFAGFPRGDHPVARAGRRQRPGPRAAHGAGQAEPRDSRSSWPVSRCARRPATS